MRIAVYVFLTLVSLAHTDTCGGNCPSDSCSTCLCGTDVSYQDATAWCNQFDGWDQQCCECIVEYGSLNNSNSVDNVAGIDYVGLWQIPNTDWDCASGNPPCDVNVNLQCAIKLWQQTDTFTSWLSCGICGCC